MPAATQKAEVQLHEMSASTRNTSSRPDIPLRSMSESRSASTAASFCQIAIETPVGRRACALLDVAPDGAGRRRPARLSTMTDALLCVVVDTILRTPMR